MDVKWILHLPDSWSNWNLEMLDFEERGKTGVPGEKPLGARERTNNKLNPHTAPGFEPGQHLWEASTLTTAPSLKQLDNRVLKAISGFYSFTLPYFTKKWTAQTSK